MTATTLVDRTSPAAGPMRPIARRLRVLQVINSLVVGGAEQLLVTLARTIDRERYDLHVCSLAPFADTPIESDLRALGIPLYSVAAEVGHDARHVASLAALVRRHNVDVLHTHLAYANTVGALVGALTHRPVVATLHNVRSVHDRYNKHGWLKQELQTQMLRHGVRTVIACAPEVRAMATDELRLPPRTVVDVPNGIDTDAFASVDLALVAARRRELLGDAPGPLVLSVGNVLPSKGHTHLVAAAGLLAPSLPGLRVAIVGRLEEAAPAVRAAIAAHGLERYVALLGQRRDVAALLAAADLFVLPSLWEGLPLALLEAMAAGTPVVATAVGGTPRVVEDGVMGRLAPPGDTAGLASAIGAMLADPKGARRMALAGQAHVRATYGADTWADHLQRIYSEVAVYDAGNSAGEYGRRVRGAGVGHHYRMNSQQSVRSKNMLHKEPTGCLTVKRLMRVR